MPLAHTVPIEMLMGTQGGSVHFDSLFDTKVPGQGHWDMGRILTGG